MLNQDTKRRKKIAVGLGLILSVPIVIISSYIINKSGEVFASAVEDYKNAPAPVYNSEQEIRRDYLEGMGGVDSMAREIENFRTRQDIEKQLSD